MAAFTVERVMFLYKQSNNSFAGWRTASPVRAATHRLRRGIRAAGTPRGDSLPRSLAVLVRHVRDVGVRR